MAKSRNRFPTPQPPSGPVRKVEFQTTQYEGPLPPGEEMRTYAELIKDGPERIMAMAEREQAHRHRVQGFVVMSGFAAQVVGTATAALVSVTFALLAYWLFKAGKDGAAFVSMLVPLGGLCSVIVWRIRKKPN